MDNTHGFRPTHFVKQVFKPSLCGETDCGNLAEGGWGRCENHLKKDLKVVELCSVCASPIIDKRYKPYLVCSARCDLWASVQEDKAQND